LLAHSISSATQHWSPSSGEWATSRGITRGRTVGADRDTRSSPFREGSSEIENCPGSAALAREPTFAARNDGCPTGVARPGIRALTGCSRAVYSPLPPPSRLAERLPSVPVDRKSVGEGKGGERER